MKRDRDNMAIKGLKWGRALTALVFVAAIISGPFVQMQSASAAGGTATWDGSAGDRKFSTAANWVENAIPEAGDMLVFNIESNPVDPFEYYEYLDNDVAVSYAGVTSTTASSTSLKGYFMTSPLQLQSNAVWNISDKLHVTADNVLATNLAATGSIPGTLTMSGVLTLKDGTYVRHLPASMAGLVVENGASVGSQNAGAITSIAYPVTLGGGAGTAIPTLNFFERYGAEGQPVVHQVFSDITLLNDAEIFVGSPNTVEVSSIVKNGFSLTRTADSTGRLTVDGESQENQAKTTQLDGDDATQDVIIVDRETAVLDGTRGSVSVGYGGLLKGNGTVAGLGVSSGGAVAPGNSPGKIIVDGNLSLSSGSTFVVEILNKDSYDQLEVSGNVDINDAILDLQFLPGGVVNQGETFTIINKTGSGAVNGTFAGLAEGAQINVNGVVFSISYVGGDGNDVVLTALTSGNAPGVGNTGIHLSLANPVVIAFLGIVASAAVLFVTTRRKATKR